MDIYINWQKPIQLTLHKKLLFDEDEIPKRIRHLPGVYFFSRVFGSRAVPFYIGESGSIRRRLVGHLKSTKIVFVLLGMDRKSGIKGGTRYFHYGYFKGRPGQNEKKCLKIVQQYLIREAMSQNVRLINEQLTAYKTHSLNFSGSKRARALYNKLAKVPRAD